LSATRPNEKWTGDITAIWTYEGWLYLAVVLDLYLSELSRWLCWLGIPQRECCCTLIAARSIPVMQARTLLADAGATVSMSRTGNCYEHAVTESFFGTLKGECVERFSFQTRGQARQTIFE
jgi:transposase InsO family protein